MTDTNTEVRRFVDRYWEQFLAQEPLFATHVGDERFDDRLSDLSEDGLAERERVHTSALAACGRFDRDTLDITDRAALDTAEGIARRELDIVRYRFDRFWAVSHMLGGHLFGPAHLLGEISTLQRADTPERLDRYLARLSAIPRYLAAVVQTMTDGIACGQTAPRLVVERSINMVDHLLATPPPQSPVLEPVTDNNGGRDRVASALSEVVYPAFAHYLDTLRNYLPKARTTIGLCALPDGEQMYAAEIRGWTTLAMQAKELHELGAAELATIEEERRQIAQRLGYPDAPSAVAAHEATGRNTPASRDELLSLVRDQVQRAWEAAPRFFGRLPQENCHVRPVPDYQEDHVLDYYQGPTPDGSRPGVFFLNTKPRPLHSMATTTYHESNPGHHFQISLAIAATDRPALWRFGAELQGAAFGEGWGLYCERLADEMGLYANDYERLGMLELQALRAARLVVDTGIHALGWDRQRAVTLLEATGLPAWKAGVEIDRYIAMPGQALCYKVAQRQIERWRAAIAQREGTEFSLADFHDRLLGLGFLPLPTLQRELGVPGAEAGREPTRRGH